MTEAFRCGDNAALIGYLYEECVPEERRAIEAHLGICPACAAELAAMRSTRVTLASWAPPEVELGFEIGRRSSTVVGGVNPAPWWRQPLPAWMQVVAASVIFGAGLWLGVAGGRMPAATDPASEVAATPAADAAMVSPGDLAALERRIRAQIAEMRTAEPATPPASPQRVDESQLLARVSALIEESEQRQRRELAIRTRQLVRDIESQRRMDLAQIQRVVGQMEGRTGAEVRDQRQLLNYLIRVSQQGR